MAIDCAAEKDLFATLPNEVLEMTIKMAMGHMNTQERYVFLVEVISKVSLRLKNITSLESLWKNFATFEKLPDEVAAIPIKMAVDSMGTTDREDFLLDVIAKVSTRFKTLASHKSLWKGFVSVYGDEKKMRQVICELLNDGITGLSLGGGSFETISANDIITMAAKCPGLKLLDITSKRVESWPTFAVPWMSLKSLILFACHMSANMFLQVELHRNLPHLETFDIRCSQVLPQSAALVLPDMGKCSALNNVTLGAGKCVVTSLPLGLRELGGSYNLVDRGTYSSIVNMDRASLESRFKVVQIEPEIQFEVSNNQTRIQKSPMQIQLL